MISGFFGEYRWLSNFWPAPVLLDGFVYPTVEHAYQAAKSIRDGDRAHFRLNITPGQAKRLSKTLPVRADWEQVKVETMRGLLVQKFRIPDLKARLLATEGPLVEENNWGDTFWGVYKGVGQNQLGSLIMEIREELRAGI